MNFNRTKNKIFCNYLRRSEGQVDGKMKRMMRLACSDRDWRSLESYHPPLAHKNHLRQTQAPHRQKLFPFSHLLSLDHTLTNNKSIKSISASVGGKPL